jgi:5-methylcytosine-specific restriction endonuclease McrA
MAEVGEITPWRTETPGERLFLMAYDIVTTTAQPSIAAQTWMVSSHGLAEFFRLVVAMELTHRCLNASVEIMQVMPHASAEAVLRELRTSVQLYGPGRQIKEVAEQSRLAAIAYTESKTSDGTKNAVHRESRNYCCWCGTHTSRGQSPEKFDQATIEHLWPIFLGGTSDLENLTIACKSCNEDRQHAFTWAWFALQAMNEKLDSNESLPGPIRLALGLHRLLIVAGGQTKISRMPVSLKDASKILRGAIPTITLQKDKRYTFFEILQMSRE